MHRRQLGRSLADADRDRQGDSRQRGDDQAVDLQGTAAGHPGRAAQAACPPLGGHAAARRAELSRRSAALPSPAASALRGHGRPGRVGQGRLVDEQPLRAGGRSRGASCRCTGAARGRPCLERGTGRQRQSSSGSGAVEGLTGARAGPRTGPHFVDLRGQGCGPSAAPSAPPLLGSVSPSPGLVQLTTRPPRIRSRSQLPFGAGVSVCVQAGRTAAGSLGLQMACS